jgi:hypothetical protein
VFVKLTGYAHRGIFNDFMEKLVMSLCGEEVDLRTVVPILRRNVSLSDYLQSLYVVPSNLLVNYSHQSDVVSADQQGTFINNYATDRLKKKMYALTLEILDNMISMPSKYQFSYLFQTLNMSQVDFKRHMRQTTLKEMTYKVGQDAYNIAL